ncbi:bifunctional 5-dehydro-2-deoxygluconokinase/5-dehydro-2-deoxyphosphogluconate aldolase [Zooshikella harenae]|uniref:5-dehydro-2-deoxygluconokinase n=1 Tax=Zooshikella harenae TaxID=2827238 RepID=A0ABS5ZD25_9GAMM|nr:5-dehydro-2-deoxygluconokinase [Zooshikella harenae]MBU2711180.1 5-dehydro-2-deoxygluconokinase [Zooshikella harenae]
MATKRIYDVICVGRAAVDLYGQQVGSKLQDISTFAKYLGGSAGNIAYGCARLGLKSAMLTRVGDEQMGEFVRQVLAQAGVDVSHVMSDPERLTGLVLLSIKDKDTFPLLFYRHDCADMALSVEDFDEAFIASARALLITGTHLSTAHTYQVCLQAIRWAKANGTQVMLDIDYRPVLWGLTKLGEGENRFVSAATVTAHIQSVLSYCDLIVGTEEEICIAGGESDLTKSLQAIRTITDAVLVVKRGPLGCVVFTEAIPNDIEQGLCIKGVNVEVLNVLGAGDAFLSGFLRGQLQGESIEQCCRYANACGAIVVSRHGCAPAMPTAEELDYFLQSVERTENSRPAEDCQLDYLHRVTTRRTYYDEEICALALDHRRQFVAMAQEAGADLNQLPELKQLLVQAVARGAAGAELVRPATLLDSTYGQQALLQISGQDWWVARPVEQPGSRPLAFEQGNALLAQLQYWPLEHIVKCLVYYHPEDSPTLRLAQEQQLLSLYQVCQQTGHELLLEVIPPDFDAALKTVPLTLQRFYNLGIYPDWWKLPALSASSWQQVTTLITERAPHCRGIVVLGLEAPIAELLSGFAIAAQFSIVKGFAVGRSVFGQSCKQWLAGEITDNALIDTVAAQYQLLIHGWRKYRKSLNSVNSLCPGEPVDNTESTRVTDKTRRLA